MKHSLQQWILITWASAATLASAQSTQGADPIEPFHARQGGAVRMSASTNPNTSGEDRRGFQISPSVEYHWDNGWMVGTDRGVAYNFSRDPALQYGLGLSADLGRRSTNTGSLAGMGSIDAKPEVAAFINNGFAKDWRLTSSLRYGSGDSRHGVQGEVGLNHTMDLAPGWRMGLNASAKWANSSYMQTYYGVTSSQSTSSGRAVYTPTGGVSEISTGVNLKY